MFIVKCTLENASENISGVAFTENEDGHMVTGEVDQATADIFDGIKGYYVIDASKDASLVERDAIFAEAEKLGTKLDKRLTTDKLRAQLDVVKADAKAKADAAEKAEAEKAAAEAAVKPDADKPAGEQAAG